MESYIEPPSHAAILRRGRRPALIPPTVDLESFFNFSPQGQHCTRPTMLVLPSVSTGTDGGSFNGSYDGDRWEGDIGKGELRWGDDRLDVDEVARVMVLKDVDCWVNSEDFDSPIFDTTLHQNSPSLFASNALRSVAFATESSCEVGSGPCSDDGYRSESREASGLITRPTSPLSNTRSEEVETQRRRLIQAGVWEEENRMGDIAAN
ncbi:hypothetical protein BJ508DRAFT_315352 [Ascobolus immersus RN42]|uniref:Uncharacterized protein n=1 Tax=Ascobolus immersus RN42 TaxID=1160509 RepID=A0A3N4HDK7_ASCIM|nr:hypothetical protein BJ508DRAFT_315352 [Ascobolus immersus RN42]